MVNLASPGLMKAIEELARGRDFANQLRDVMKNGDHGSSSSSTPLAEQLVKKVLMSFTNSLLHLNNTTNSEVSGWINNNPAKSEDSQESNCKSSTIKERRGCYKRRRTSQTCEKESETPTDDGHQWRKYGQKEILNAKYPRNYYRCTHKYDQNCQATKQVQRVQDDPPLYKTIYYNNHTCRNLVNPDIILDPNSPSDSSIFLCFDNTQPASAKQDCPFLSSSSFPSPPLVKKECKEEIPSSSSNNYLLSPELTLDNNNNSSSRHVTLSSTLGSDNRDVMSGFFYDSAELEQVFEPFLEFS